MPVKTRQVTEYSATCSREGCDAELIIIEGGISKRWWVSKDAFLAALAREGWRTAWYDRAYCPDCEVLK